MLTMPQIGQCLPCQLARSHVQPALLMADTTILRAEEDDVVGVVFLASSTRRVQPRDCAGLEVISP